MRWEDERYVRLYTRDTVAWKMLPWQAKALLPLLLRKLDRAGVMDLGGEDAVDAATVATDLPREVVGPGLRALLKRDTIQVTKTTIVMPNYIAAQEAAQSDKQRKAEQRGRARDVAAAEALQLLASPSEGVTFRDEKSQAVTSSHVESLLAVPSRAVPSRAVPSRAEPAEPEGKGADAPASRLPSPQEQFFAWMQALRREEGLELEPERPAKAVNTMLKPPIREVGVEGTQGRYRAFLKKAYWGGADKDPRWPLEGFLSCWKKLKPVESTNDMFDAYEPEAAHVR